MFNLDIVTSNNYNKTGPCIMLVIGPIGSQKPNTLLI